MTTSIYNTKYIIYKHTNTISRKSYIGKTIQGLDVRWKSHLSQAKRRAYNSHFHKAILKYGADSWEHELLFVSFLKDDEYLYDVEEELIERYDTVKNGYNISIGGRGIGSGADNPRFGKTHSEESRHKISEALKGRTHSEEAREKMSEATKGTKHPNYGKRLSDETKRNISVGNRGKIRTQETRDKMSEVRMGKSHSDETKQKMSVSRKGKNNPNFVGHYHTPWGVFSSRYAGGTTLCSDESVRNWCKNSHKIISNQSISHSKYLKSLNESPLGKTFRDLGFGFEPI